MLVNGELLARLPTHPVAYDYILIHYVTLDTSKRAKMSRPYRTCDSCFKMISSPHLLEQACSPEGLNITQTVEDFLHSLELGYYLCQEIRKFSEHNQQVRFTNSFYHIEKDKPLFKNVKCRKIDRQGNPYEIPRDFHFDEMEIRLGSPNASEEVMLDVQALDGKLVRRFVFSFG